MFGRKGNAAPKPKTRQMRLLLSYAPDWIVTIGLAAAFFLLDKIDGFRREFSLTDTTIQHTYTVHERVPNWLLIVICFAVPAVIMPTVNMLTVRSWWDWHNSMLGLILGLATTGAVTQVVKVTVGRPRPDAIARCKPIEGATDHAVFGLVTTSICTETDMHIMKDGWRSFFSGHSSLSFAGLGFLSFYLAGKLHLFDERGHTGKAWIALAPLVGAILTAVSRTMDYRHHWQDVLVGSVVGLVFAYFSYRQYYPTLESPFSHKPYSPRIPRDEYRDSSLPFAIPQTSDEDYSGVVYRRQQNGKGLYADGASTSNTYPPLGHGTGSETRLRPVEPRYDEESAIGVTGTGRASPVRASPPLAGRLSPPKDTVPRPSGEPLVEMYPRDRERAENSAV